MPKSGFYVFLFLFVAGTVVSGGDTDVRFLRGLVDRSLFESVEFFCSRELSQENVTEIKKYRIAEELIRSRTQQLLLAEPKQREVILKKLTELEKNLLTVPSAAHDAECSLSRLQVQFQFALTDYLFGDWQRLEADVSAETEYEPKIKQARQTLLSSLERFNQCTETLSLLTQKISEPELRQQAVGLSRLLDIQKGLARMSFALTFPPGDDRTFGLEQAVGILSGGASIPVDDRAVFRCRIESATAYRLLDNTEQCRKQLETLGTTTLPRDLQFVLAAEMLRYLITVKELDTALTNYGNPPADSWQYPDFQLARLELLLAVDRRFIENNVPKERQDEHRQTVAVLVRDIEQRAGTYWGRRARMILVSSHSVQKNKADAVLLKLLAEERFQSGNFSEAVQLFDAAGKRAEEEGKPEEAFYNAAASAAVLDSLLKRLKPETNAAGSLRLELLRRLCGLAKRFPQQKESEEYYLKAIDFASQAMKQNEMPIADYIGLLKEYTGTWKDSPKTPPVLLRLAVLLERQGQHNESQAILEKIPALKEQFFTALSADEKKTFQKNKARTLAEEGNVQEAVNILRGLIKENKNDLTLLQLLAEILSQRDDEDALKVAVQLWTTIADRSPKNGQLWWTAREGLFHIKLKQGKTEEARKEYSVLKLLYPDLGGTERKERFSRYVLPPGEQ